MQKDETGKVGEAPGPTLLFGNIIWLNDNKPSYIFAAIAVERWITSRVLLSFMLLFFEATFSRLIFIVKNLSLHFDVDVQLRFSK